MLRIINEITAQKRRCLVETHIHQRSKGNAIINYTAFTTKQKKNSITITVRLQNKDDWKAPVLSLQNKTTRL